MPRAKAPPQSQASRALPWRRSFVRRGRGLHRRPVLRSRSTMRPIDRRNSQAKECRRLRSYKTFSLPDSSSYYYLLLRLLNNRRDSTGDAYRSRKRHGRLPRCRNSGQHPGWKPAGRGVGTQGSVADEELDGRSSRCSVPDNDSQMRTRGSTLARAGADICLQTRCLGPSSLGRERAKRDMNNLSQEAFLIGCASS